MVQAASLTVDTNGFLPRVAGEKEFYPAKIDNTSTDTGMWGVAAADVNVIAENDYRLDAVSKVSRWAINVPMLLFVGGLLAGCWPKLKPGPEGGGGGNGNGDSNTDRDCPWLTSAAIGELSSLPLIIDQQTLNNPDALQADIKTCIDQGMFQGVSQDNDLAVVSIAAPDNQGGQTMIQPIWAVVDKSASGGMAPLMLFSADQNQTAVSQNGAEVVMQLHPVSLQDGKIVSGESSDQATLVDIGDGNYRLDHKGRSLNLTADELGQMIGGGFLIGAMEEFKSVIAADQLEFSQATRFNGVSPREFLGIEKPQGVPEVLPQDVLRSAMEMGLRPVYYGATEISSFCNAQSCEAMLYDHLVTGATITESTNGQVIYVLPGQPGTTAFYKFDGLPDGVRPAFFIAGDDNKYGVISGTVMALFYRGGGKGPAQVLNIENPLKPLVDKPNRAEVIVTDKGLTMTTFDAGGNVIEDGVQEVLFLPPLPSEFLAQFPGGQFQVVDNQIIANDGTVWFKLNEAWEWEQKVFTMRQAMIKMDQECDPYTKGYETPTNRIRNYLHNKLLPLESGQYMYQYYSNVVGLDINGYHSYRSCWYFMSDDTQPYTYIIYGVLDENDPSILTAREITIRDYDSYIKWDTWPPK